jgi:hypothetical protein
MSKEIAKPNMTAPPQPYAPTLILISFCREEIADK